MANRFVIHIHKGYGPEHYDLMLEHGRALATWRLSQPPSGVPEGEASPARKIGNHRLSYLDYEGPISRGRGHVTMWDSGGCELLSTDQSRWQFRLTGRKLRGRFELRRLAEDEWILKRLTDPHQPGQ
ncbi:MAG: DNA polymerase ligase N-terminal domain-containing protein [Planctomycetota bacterium]|jgi:hypothetical protein